MATPALMQMAAMFPQIFGRRQSARTPGFNPNAERRTQGTQEQTYPFPAAGPMPGTAEPQPAPVPDERGMLTKIGDSIRDPRVMTALLTAGNALTRPMQPGESELGRFVNSITQSYSALGNMEQLRRQRQMEAAKLGLEQRRVATGERQAQTAADLGARGVAVQEGTLKANVEDRQEGRKFDRDKFAEQSRQFNEELEQRRNQAAQTIGLDRAKLDEAIRSNRVGEISQNLDRGQKERFHKDLLEVHKAGAKSDAIRASAYMLQARTAADRTDELAGAKVTELLRISDAASAAAAREMANRLDFSAEDFQESYQRNALTNFRLAASSGRMKMTEEEFKAAIGFAQPPAPGAAPGQAPAAPAGPQHVPWWAGGAVLEGQRENQNRKPVPAGRPPLSSFER